MATFLERAAHTIYHMFSKCILTYCSFNYFPLGFEGGNLVLTESVPGS